MSAEDPVIKTEAIPRLPGFNLRSQKVGRGCDAVMFRSWIDRPDGSVMSEFDYLIAPLEAAWYVQGYLAAEAVRK
jgi:hypothetical protein